jgi:putative copper resistance protein D
VIDPLTVARALHLAATAVTAGMIFFELMVARPVLGRANAAAAVYVAILHRWVGAAFVLAILSGFAWALLIAMQIADITAVQALTDGTLATLLTDTRFGQVWLWRALLLVIVALTFMPTNRSAGWLRLIAASLLLASVAWVGHSAARSDAVGWLQVSADMAHLLAAGVWLGSLPALAIMLKSRLPAGACAAATRRFSTFGMAAVATLLLSGVFNTCLLTNSIIALPETAYGQLILLKMALFAAMLTLAAINKWHWTPRLPTRAAMAAIRRHSLMEAGLGLAVLFAVGVLGTLPPPLHRHVHAGSATDEAFVHIHDIRGMADIKIATAGEVEIRLMREDFTPLSAQGVSIQLSQAGQSPIAAEARPDADGGLWRTQPIALPASGVWTIAVTVLRPDAAPLVLDGPILIGPSSAAKTE